MIYFSFFPLGWIYSDCYERICKCLGMSNEGQWGEWRSAGTCGIIWSWTVEEVVLELLKLICMSELHCTLKPGTLREAMSSRILTLCSLWPEDASSACKLFSTFTKQSMLWQGWAKWEETLCIHPSDLCLQR